MCSTAVSVVKGFILDSVGLLFPLLRMTFGQKKYHYTKNILLSKHHNKIEFFLISTLPNMQVCFV